MSPTRSTAVIAGDGIGQEVVPAAIGCLDRVAGIYGLSLEVLGRIMSSPPRSGP